METVFFDLDGTLLDTAPDLAYALNTVLIEEGRAPLPLATIRAHVSHGSPGLMRIGFGLEPDAPGAELLCRRLLAIYEQNLARHTCLFPGMAQVIDTLDKRKIGWGVVTNKLAYLTSPLLDQLGLSNRAVCVVSGDTAARSKPWPDPLFMAADLAGADPQNCIYIGDAARDVEAGRSAGMQTLVALFGYLGPDDDPTSWGADGFIESPSELLNWL